MKLKLASILVALGIVGGFFFPLAQAPVEIVREVPATGIALPQAPAVFETSLASPISTSATSMTLTANAIRGGSAVAGYSCFTIDEGSASREDVCGTVSGTSVTAMTRGINPANGTSTVSALQFAHRRGANVKVTDFPILTIMRNQLNGVERFENLLLYSTTSEPCAVGSATGTICAKAYIDAIAVAGASNGDDTTKGIFERATLAEASSTTALGGTGAALAIGANLVGATPFASGIVMAQSTGKILQGWLDLAVPWIFSGGFTSTASSTFTSNVTFASTTQHNATSTFNAGVVGLIDVQEFTASSSWIKPNGVSTSSMMMIELWGAGGGGGGSNSAGGLIAGGGGGGAYVRHYMLTSSATSTVFCRVASGGPGGAAGSNIGTSGENTVFGSYVTAYGGGAGGFGAANAGASGGGGGQTGKGGDGSNGGGVTSGGGPGAVTTASQDGFAGGFGTAYNGSTCGDSMYGGGGGGTSGSAACGSVYGGAGGGRNGGGGTSIFGGNGATGGGAGTNGVQGSAPGGGGSAGYSAGSNQSGGAGARGQCRITTWK